jgi:hypothetical protein
MHAHDVHAYEMHANKVHAHNVHARGVHATMWYAHEGPSALEHRRTSVPAPATVSASSHMGFSRRRGVLKATI